MCMRPIKFDFVTICHFQKRVEFKVDSVFYWCNNHYIKCFLPIHPTGPDICGYSTKKVHVIFNYKGKNHLIKKEIKCKVRHFKFLSIELCYCILPIRPFFASNLTPAVLHFVPSGWRADTPVHSDHEPVPDIRGEDQQWEGGVRHFGGGLGHSARKDHQGPWGQEARGLGRQAQDWRSYRHQARGEPLWLKTFDQK